ncbi:hypothetical protein BJY00DRAFT_64185 [Aspergillus carlsbadensis]|nr:hypothetical protein BJY00DRAFT_64185 [Aspergillus carlsbadensis]
MASIQKLGVSAVNAVAETNVSLLHGNFDFSLFKCQVPAELIPVGERLSKPRRETAEAGSFHILARRLGIIFEDILPSVPSLLRAYGTRASQISSAMDTVPAAPQRVKEGVFGQHLGIDSTTIWASATSGPSALCMHLLACMLARIWSPLEATAIWVELVEHRRQIIKAQASETTAATGNFHLSQLAAVHDIGRETLEGWDASARAWLQVADGAKKKQQVQLQLIVNNLSVAVKSQGTSEDDQPLNAAGPLKENLHENVIRNLYRALKTLDNLVSGNPQRISDGGVLLAMTAWHLYPDLIVLNRKALDISQGDELVHGGGIATISVLTSSDPHDKQDGVYWSLPLANLRYYGTVQRERSSFHDSRVSLSELQALALGASLEKPGDAMVASSILTALWEHCYKICEASPYADMPPWKTPNVSEHPMTPREEVENCSRAMRYIRALRGGMTLLLSDDKKDQDVAMHLVRYGANNAQSWIGKRAKHKHNFFGMAYVPSLLTLINNSEMRVQLLLQLCPRDREFSETHIIRYLKDDNSWGYVPLLQATGEMSHASKRRKAETDTARPFSELEPPPNENWIFHTPESPSHVVMIDSVVHAEEVPSSDPTFDFLHDDPDERTPVGFDLRLGYYKVAAVFVRNDGITRNTRLTDTVPIEAVNDLVRADSLDMSKVVECWLSYYNGSGRAHGKSLLVLGETVDYYQTHLPQARVSMRMIKEPIYNWKWARPLIDQLEARPTIPVFRNEPDAPEGSAQDKRHERGLGHDVSRLLAFAMILQFETGTISVEPEGLKDVMAISCGNSLFIARCLLQDPIHSLKSNQCGVVHAFGNVGKTGVALMHAPAGVRVREHDIDRWHVVSHSQFDGSQSDGVQFEGTSLHMSFTGGKGPVNVGPSGFCGMEAYYLETKVSLYDGGEWVADLDILKALEHSRIWTTLVSPPAGPCSHNTPFTSCGMRLVSIDCWEEILCPPSDSLVLRSGPSWMARLAGLSIGVSKSYRCVCLSGGEVCWSCFADVVNARHNKTDILFIY